jgi:hypothetical protein
MLHPRKRYPSYPVLFARDQRNGGRSLVSVKRVKPVRYAFAVRVYSSKDKLCPEILPLELTPFLHFTRERTRFLTFLSKDSWNYVISMCMCVHF